jgi:peptidoglycan biosynthesis protein MviN/MurJ (putative lipid II flippase)
MFNIKYNILALIGILIGFVSSILQIKTFGVSEQTDSYMIAFSIVFALNLFQLMLVEQFMFFYNDYKVHGIEKAQAFYRSVVTVGLVWGVLFYLCCTLLVDQIVYVFASGFQQGRLLLLKQYLYINLITTVFFPLNFVNDQLMNAEMKISVPYLLNIFPNLAIMLSYAYILFFGKNDIIICVYAHLAGFALSFVLRFLYISRFMRIPLRFEFNIEKLRPFITNSITMRFSHNMHNLIVNPITNNILSHLPSGSVSCYYYAEKFITILQSVMAGPSNIILGSKISFFWSNKDHHEIVKIIKYFLKIIPGLFIASFICVYFIIPYFFLFVSSSNVTARDIDVIQMVFILMALWQLIILFEAPFVRIILSSKDSKYLLLVNTQFIVLYFLLTRFLLGLYGIDAIPISCIMAQLVSVVLFVVFARRMMKKVMAQ